MSSKAGKRLVPKLRFPEFRNMPPWVEKSLKKLCKINPSNGELPERFVYVDLESVVAGELITKKIIRKEDAPSRAQRILKDGDTIFQMVRPYQKNNFLFRYEDNVPYVASTGYAQLRPYESSGFLYQLVHLDSFVENVVKRCTGSSYPAINSTDLGEISAFVPDEREQQKIADCLSSIDELITAQGKKIVSIKAHKKGLMQQLFPLDGETVPRLRFPEFRNAISWKEKHLQSLLREIARPIEMKDDFEYSLVTVKRRYGGVEPRGVFQGKSIQVKSQFLIKENDFLISKRQIVHSACGIVPKELEDSIVSNEYSVLEATQECDIRFFWYFAQQPKVSESFLISSRGIVIEKMLFDLDYWLKKKFMFPQLSEQRKIGNFLASIDNLIITHINKLDSLKTYKKGLIQGLFPSTTEV